MANNGSITPPIQVVDNKQLAKKHRDSNLELYRIIVMLMIVAHHYVVNSGLMSVLNENAGTAASNAMMLFGAWGKTGINCFVLITGYFMCRSNFSWRKLLKLYLQVIFYGLTVYGIFCLTGHETFHPLKAALKLFPVRSISSGFVSCFLLFYLFIPFINIFLAHIDRRNHAILMTLLIFVYSVLPSIPGINMTFNYVEWFICLYIIASYLRFYGTELNISHRQWGIAAIMSILLGSASVIAMNYFRTHDIIHSFTVYFFVADSNKLIALMIAVTSFMWFKELKIKYIPLVNIMGASTFGVLLIHANSDTMRQWLWKETVDCPGHFSTDVLLTLGYAAASVIVIFAVCSAIEWLRATFIEPSVLKITERAILKAKESKWLLARP